jgi:ketosteroid isomerase-like protein
MAADAIVEGAEVVHRMYDAYNRGDIDETMAQLHPEIEVRLAMDPMEPIAGSRHELHGHDGLRAFWQQLYDSWEEGSVEIKEIIEGVEGRAISFETWRVRGPQGIDIDTEVVDVYGFRDGLIVSCDGFRDKNEALEAFGIRE